MNRQTKKQRTANKGFASGGLKSKTQQQFFDSTLVIDSAFVLIFSAGTQSPEPLAVIVKRQSQSIDNHKK
jgi:hypothetical protein